MAILTELLGAGCLGDAIASARRAEGIDPGRASVEEDERAFIEPGALIHDLSPPFVFDATDVLRAPPRYRWTRHPAGT